VAHAPFVHLHLHTQYSLLDGAIRHGPLFARANELAMPAVGITDHGNLFGAIEFYEAAVAARVKPIIGCEVYLASGSRFEKEKREHDASGFDAINHLLLLAMNETGYRNLMYLVSKAYLEGFYYKPRIDLDLLRERNAGLIATSGCLSSMMSRAITGGQRDRAWELCQDFSEIFDDRRFYLEMQRHGIDLQDQVNAELVKMASDFNLPLVATNDAHYLEEHDAEHHEALLCIGTGTNLDDPKRLRFDGKGFYVKSADDMVEVFHDHPSAVANTLEIAERCNLELDLGTYHLPEFQVPSGTTREQVLADQSWAGLRGRLGLSPDEPFAKKQTDYVERMEHELGVIQSMGFPGYFLIVADFIDFARRKDIPVGPGRGSSAGSLVAYALGITGIDPIEYDIIFERFLNPERISMPDIDVDFCMRGRDEVIRYVADKYNEGERDEDKRVAQIITFGKLQARASIRDCGRALGIPYSDVDRIAKLVPETLGISLKGALEESPDLRARVDGDGQVRRLIETAMSLEGLTRHASTHAAGVVIGNQPLIETVPLYRDPRSGDTVTQFDMRCVERVGLVKFDFLGLKTLTLIADAEKLIRERHDPKFSIDDTALDDEATYALLCKGDTQGVFQVESAGMTELTVKLKPSAFIDLIPIVALYRPGPLGSGMVDDFVSRRHGLTKVEYLLPELEELTAETYGVIVYQDQVLQIANRVAGYSLGEADLLRRAMGKKKPEEMEKQRDRFLSGSTENGHDAKKAEQLFDLINEFAGYGFPKAHSAAYALLTHQTAFLKANYLQEYLAALLSIEAGNHDRLSRFLAHTRENGIEVLPPDVNESGSEFTVVEEGIRFGMAGVKNVGTGAIEAILEARAEDGRFKTLFDFCSRVDSKRVNRRVVESLVKCGAFESIHDNRAATWAALDGALESGASAQRDREIGQESLFAMEGAVVAEPELPKAAAWADRERLAYEREALGFYVTGHPLEPHLPALRRFADTTAAETEGKEGVEVRVGGLVTSLRETRTRKGDRMAFATLEDMEGSFDLVVFAEAFARLGEVLKKGLETIEGQIPDPILVSGTLEAGDTPKLLVRDAMELASAEERLSTELHLRVVAGELSRDRLEAMKNVLAANKGDCSVVLHMTIPGESETLLALSDARGVRPTEELMAALDGLFGRPVTELTV